VPLLGRGTCPTTYVDCIKHTLQAASIEKRSTNTNHLDSIIYATTPTFKSSCLILVDTVYSDSHNNAVLHAKNGMVLQARPQHSAYSVDSQQCLSHDCWLDTKAVRCGKRCCPNCWMVQHTWYTYYCTKYHSCHSINAICPAPSRDHTAQNHI
jgi:hypothetical protein